MVIPTTQPSQTIAMNTPELTTSQKELFNKILVKGFDRGVVSMVRCLRAVSARAERVNEPEPTLTEMAQAIEDALNRKHSKK